MSRTSVSDSSENNKGAEGLRDLLTNKKDSAKEPKLKESLNPDLLIAANKTVSGIIESAKQQVTEMNSKDEKATANKSKQEQVKKMIDDFFKSDDEDDEEEDDDEEDEEEEDKGGGMLYLAAHVNVNSMRELYKRSGRHLNISSRSLYFIRILKI